MGGGDQCGQLGTGNLIISRSFMGRAVLVALAGVLAVWPCSLGAVAGGPVETSIYAVQGVEVDVTSTDAASAKNKALMDVQVKAFIEMVARLGSPEMAADVQEKMKPEDIAPYLRSLSIEQESSAPGRYIGRFTVRFLPQKMQKFFADRGVRLPETQADPIVVLPVYRAPDGLKLWEDNPWRKAWIDLKGEQGLVPIIVPLGDLEDTGTITAVDAANGDAIKLDAVRKRYGAPSLLVAQAQPAEGGGVHVYIEGATKLGDVKVNKIYEAEGGSPQGAESAAVAAFQAMLVKTYQEESAKTAAAEAARSANRIQSIAVSVPFSSPREWNAIRSRILSTPHVNGVDLSSLSADGAVIKLVFTRTIEELQENMRAAGLNLVQSGPAWIIQSM
jgi:hypothetical protein